MGYWWKRRQEHYVVNNEEFHVNEKRTHWSPVCTSPTSKGESDHNDLSSIRISYLNTVFLDYKDTILRVDRVCCNIVSKSGYCCCSRYSSYKRHTITVIVPWLHRWKSGLHQKLAGLQADILNYLTWRTRTKCGKKNTLPWKVVSQWPENGRKWLKNCGVLFTCNTFPEVSKYKRFMHIRSMSKSFTYCVLAKRLRAPTRQ